jgi:hypothetical protein
MRPVDRLPGRLAGRIQADPAKVRIEVEHQADRTVTRRLMRY